LRAYADTSFLVSLYTPDANSASAGAHMKNLSTALLLTPFGELELLNAFELRVFRGELSITEVEAARAALREDVEKGIYARRPFPEAAFARAKEIARKRTARLGTRALDILHVGSALVLQADTFYSFDRNQRRLARAEGLKTPWRSLRRSGFGYREQSRPIYNARRSGNLMRIERRTPCRRGACPRSARRFRTTKSWKSLVPVAWA